MILVAANMDNAVTVYRVQHREISMPNEETPADWHLIGLAVDDDCFVRVDNSSTSEFVA
jgi:hypothetical protein